MRYPIAIAIILSMTLVAGCKILEPLTAVATTAAAATGVISSDQARYAQSGVKVAGKTFDAMKDITPEQEYYIGRAVGATVLKAYKPYSNKLANQYINTLGQALAMASDKPETFGGYHFLILETDEINAFATPGGFIFVSRGLLRCCKNEDMVAAVLAHEVAHVQFAHGLGSIKKSRWTSAATTALAEAGKNLGGAQLAQLTEVFEGSITDITSTMINSGYARKYETEADKAAVTIMKRVGYNPRALESMLLEMDKLMKHSKGGFAKTHPDPKSRIKDIKKLIKDYAKVSSPAVRQARFEKAMAQL